MYFSGQDGPLPLQPSPRASRGIRLALLVFYFLALHLLALHLLAVAQQSVTEDQVKAAYLLNFAKAAQWPAGALPEGPSPMVIGVSGGDEDFLAVLKAVVAGKVIGTHPLEARPVSSAEDMKSCHIVFFRASDKKRTRAVIESVTQAGVLFVGEDESFLRQGGMINLVRDHGSVHFEVNADALDRSQIHFSAKILTLAKTASAPPHATPSNPPDDGPRQVKHRVEPDYPEIAERLKLTGTVQLEALVKPDGTVKEVRVVGGPPVLVDAVVQAVLHWKYQPASNETRETVKFSFGPR
jgi:TonB family protein